MYSIIQLEDSLNEGYKHLDGKRTSKFIQKFLKKDKGELFTIAEVTEVLTKLQLNTSLLTSVIKSLLNKKTNGI